jgi:hypothetical protein
MEKLKERNSKMTDDIKNKEAAIYKLAEENKEQAMKCEDQEQRLKHFDDPRFFIMSYFETSEDNSIFYQLYSKIFDFELLKDNLGMKE